MSSKDSFPTLAQTTPAHTISTKPPINPAPLPARPSKEKRYKKKQLLGEGAYGKVWKVRDTQLDRDIAIKTFKKKGEMGQYLCHLEIKRTGKLDNPGIPTIYDVGEHNGEHYFTMKYIEGDDLGSIIKKLRAGDEATHQRFPFVKRAEICLQILRILMALHKENILHRDIKPDNILISPTGHAYLMDWGIALDLTVNNGEGQLCGTPMYMSPEQCKQEALDPRSDLYSLSAVFYELISLKYYGPPPSDDVQHYLLKIPDWNPPQVDLIHNPVNGGYPPSEYMKFIHQGLEHHPDERFISAEQMLIQLESIMNGDFCSVCVRTTIKRRLHDYANLLDWNPYITVPISVFSFVGFCMLLIFLGRLSTGLF